MKRRRFRQVQSLEQRLAASAEELRSAAKVLPPGRKRENLLRKARQNEVAAQISDWLRPPVLAPATDLGDGNN